MNAIQHAISVIADNGGTIERTDTESTEYEETLLDSDTPEETRLEIAEKETTAFAECIS